MTRRAVVIAMLAMFAMPTSAHADRKTAERYFRAGTKAYQAQHFFDAAQNFEQAYAQLAAPEIAFSAGQAYRRQYRVDGDVENARLSVQFYKLYLEQVKSGGRIGDAADSLGEMLRELDKRGVATRVSTRTEETRLGVSVVFADKQISQAMHEVDDKDAVPPAQVIVKASIDGKPVTPDALNPVAPGDHLVRVEADGYHVGEKKVHVIAGAPENVELELQPLDAQVSIVTEAGAKISLDGRAMGVAPTGPLAMPAGHHLITVLRTGRQATGAEIVTTRAEHKTLELTLQRSSKRRAVPYVLAAAGGLLVFTGISGLGAWHWDRDAKGKLAELRVGNQDPSVLDDYNTSRSRRDTIETSMWFTMSAAVVVAASAAGLYYLDTPSADGVHVVPLASPIGAGAMVSGRF